MDSDPAFLSTQVKRGDYYFLNLTPEATADLEVVCGGREVCGEDYVVDRTGFRWWSVEYVASGLGRATLAGQTVSLVPGTVFFYGPTTPHRLQVQPGSTLVKYFVDFVGHEGERLLARAFSGAPSRVTSGPTVQRLFEDLRTCAETLTDTRSAVCSLLVQQLLTLLPDKTMSSPFHGEPWKRYQTLKARLAELALSGAHVTDAAKACHVSPSYLARLFRQFDRESPHRYLLRCRMAFAASLLLDQSLLIKEVATMTGYDDPYQFSRTFKSVYGQSPDRFRNLRG